MPWYSGLVFVLLLLTGCSSTIQPQIGKKAFQDEDIFIVKGLLQEETNLTKAAQTFDFLYKKTNKPVYFKEVIKIYFDKKDYNKSINLVDNFIKEYPKQETNVIKYKIYSYIKLENFDKALKVAKEYLKNNRNLDMYKIISYIYIQKKEYKNAIKYLKSAYSISHSAEVLAQMGDLFFKELNKPNEAISYYQTHIRLYGCNELICTRLANVYKFLYDYDNLIEIYKKIYLSTNNLEYARKIVYIYLELGEYDKALKFVKKYKLSKNLLMLIYKTRFEQTQSYEDAYQLYKYTHNYHYFFLYSVYKFQNSKKGLLDLKNLIANLEILIQKSRKPLYLNYLGYVLIDYDINPKKGVQLLKEALVSQPNAPEFLDSLAWGYYKLKKCKKAYDIISKIKIDDKDINKHKKLIRRCYDTTKNNKQNKRKSNKR